MTSIVITPALHGAVVEDGAGVVVSGGDCFGGAAGAEVDGCAWCVGVGVCSVAELTSIVITPALHGAVVEDGAGVVVSGGDCFGGAAGAEVDGCAWCVGVGVCSVAELTSIVITPALHGAVVEDGAGVVVSGGDCGGGAAGAEVDGCAWCVGVGVCSVAELTIEVESPACDASVVEDGAGVVVSGSDGGCGAARLEVDGCSWIAVDVCVSAVTKLAESVAAPAGDGAVEKQCAGVSATGGDCGRGSSDGQGDGCTWCVGTGGCSVAELAESVAAPAGDGSVVEQCTRVQVAGGDGGCDASSPEIDGFAWCVGVGG